MNTTELKDRLLKMSTSQIKRLAATSGVNVRTLWFIRAGVTKTASEKTKEALYPKRRKPTEDKT